MALDTHYAAAWNREPQLQETRVGCGASSPFQRATEGREGRRTGGEALLPQYSYGPRRPSCTAGAAFSGFSRDSAGREVAPAAAAREEDWELNGASDVARICLFNDEEVDDHMAGLLALDTSIAEKRGANEIVNMLLTRAAGTFSWRRTGLRRRGGSCKRSPRS